MADVVVTSARSKCPHIQPSEFDDLSQLVDSIEKTVLPSRDIISPSEPVREGWKTIRIIVSSTFGDMHFEREKLVKEVFPHIRVYCEDYKLRVVECDLRWGVPTDVTAPEMFRLYLAEVDRCRNESPNPFFVGVLGDRYGWIPPPSIVPDDLRTKYQWIDAVSVTHMEFLHGAYRSKNPNALFLLRKGGYLRRMCQTAGVQYLGNPNDPSQAEASGDGDQTSLQLDPQTVSELQTTFIDTGKNAAKLAVLKEMLNTKFDDSQVKEYSLSCDGNVDQSGHLQFKGEDFATQCKTFLEKSISQTFPLNKAPSDGLLAERLAHDTFVESRGEFVLGRDEVIDKLKASITEQVESDAPPLMLVGGAGAGKSALMAHIVREVRSREPDSLVFFHFVGATPGSTDLIRLLHRLYKELEARLPDEELVESTSSFIQSSPARLGKKILLFVDAVNQLDADVETHILQWIPDSLPRNTALILSMINGSDVHTKMRRREPVPGEILVEGLEQAAKEEIVKSFLSQYNKHLTERQLSVLTSKEDSGNPLWLLTACEELRVYGVGEKLEEKIFSLQPKLLDLLQGVLRRICDDFDKSLATATLCLLECSRHGLLESELLELLADRESLVYHQQTEDVDVDTIMASAEGSEHSNSGDGNNPELLEHVRTKRAKAYRQEADNLEDISMAKDQGSEGQSSQVIVDKPRLPHSSWLPVYYGLRRFLRPCGEPGGGRLDFYHRTVSKAVRLSFFPGDEGGKYQLWWHQKLASFFEVHRDDLRRSEELPYHLEKVLDKNRLATVLTEWSMFDYLMTSPARQGDLLKWCRLCGGYQLMQGFYCAALHALAISAHSVEEQRLLCQRTIKVGRFLVLAGLFDAANSVLLEGLKLAASLYGDSSIEVADVLLYLAEGREQLRGSTNSPNNGRENTITIEYCQRSMNIRMSHDPVDRSALGDTLFVLVMNLVALSKDLYFRLRMVESQEKIDDAIAAANECFQIRSELQEKVGEAMMGLAMPHWRNHQVKLDRLLAAYQYFCRVESLHSLGTARVSSNIGLVLQQMRQRWAALYYHKHAFVVRVELLGPQHPKTRRSRELYVECSGDENPEGTVEEYRRTRSLGDPPVLM